MEMKVKLVVWFMFMLMAPGYGSTTRRNLEVEQHLSRLNKPAVKSIKSPDGDIIDCINISHQPAFDHPHLKNHTIQMIPSYHPEGLGLFRDGKRVGKKKMGPEPVTQLWHKKGRCPQGTIPVRRTRKEDLLRASSIQSFGKKKHKSIPRPNYTAPQTDLVNQNWHTHAIAYVKGDQYYGAKAAINVWNPKIEQTNEFSLTQLWLLGGSYGSDLNSVEAGWQVFPDLYGDYNPRLFTYWTSDDYRATGCYNLMCSGFIQINNQIAMGASMYPISSYGGSQYDITIFVWKDPKEGNWWMQYDKYVLGYWPASLFSYLSQSASMVEWGGEVYSAPGWQHTTTEMGSGHFPSEGYGKSSYVRNIQVVDESNNLRAPGDVGTIREQSSCYDIQLGRNGEWGDYFYYGGPGRNPNCQ